MSAARDLERTSVCPACHRLIAATRREAEHGVYLEKSCPEHGQVRVRIAGSLAWLSSLQEYTPQSFEPLARQTASAQGCPQDCGECPDHRQKAAFFLFEVTDACNLDCPVCLGQPRAAGGFVSLPEFERMADAVVAYAGPGQICSLGGGEPTLHPRFFDLVAALKARGLPDIWLYTNGRRVARDRAFTDRLVQEGLCVILQWDGFDDAIYERLRGRPLLAEKQQALANLRAHGAHMGLCVTAAAGVNDHELGRIYSMFMAEPGIGTLDIATMAYVGKGESFTVGMERRLTSEDVLALMESQTGGALRAADFSPVSFSHPECLQIAYHLAEPGGGLPLRRVVAPADYRRLVSNKPLLSMDSETEDALRKAIDDLWARPGRGAEQQRGLAAMRHAVETLFPLGGLSAQERKSRSLDLVKVVLVHSYMDGLNFDLDRAKMCISRTMLPDGRLMPTCAYNVLHRTAAPVIGRNG